MTPNETLSMRALRRVKAIVSFSVIRPGAPPLEK